MIESDKYQFRSNSEHPTRRIYLSGRISGLDPEEYRANFLRAEQYVLDHYPDSTVINPATLPQDCDTWADYMIRDLQLLKTCDTIVRLPDWIYSAGATIECMFASKMKIEHISLRRDDIYTRHNPPALPIVTL